MTVPEYSPRPRRLRVEDHAARTLEPGRALPVALSARPRLSWILDVVRAGQAQSAYQVLARADPDRGEVPVWDSGLVESAQNAHVVWGGPPLGAHRRLRWSVRTWDERGEVSAWSAPADLVVGPLTAEDWTAQWIELAPGSAGRVTTTLPHDVRRATLHLAGHGPLRVSLDGSWVNPDASDPSRTSLARVASRSYDVTPLLAPGAEHVLAVVAGTGHYRRVLERARLLVELVVETTDGRVVRVGTSPSWRTGATSLVTESPFYVEEHDARIPDAWREPGFDDSGWAPVSAPTSVPASIQPDAGPPTCVVERLPAVELTTHVFDVGRNIAGRSRVVVRGAAPGTRLEVVHGEKLDGDGHVDTLNIRLPDDAERERQLVVWHCAGGIDEIEAWLTYHGFRYVEVRGLPDGASAEVTAHVLHSDLERTGTFSSDDAQLDRLVAMAAAGQCNNTHGHPEDCPTREQGAWTGDASVSAEAAFAHLDMAGTYRNWLADVALDQRRDGGVLGVAPHLLGDELVQPADPVWGSAMSEIPVQHWRHVGDRGFVELILPAVRRWVQWQLGTLEGGVVHRADISYGADWLAPERTPAVMLQTAAVIRSLRALAELEAAVGDADASTRCANQADALVRPARAALRDPVTGVWANGSQGSAAVALDAGLAYGEDELRMLADQIRADVHSRGDRVSTGFAATQALVHALADADGGTAALAAVHQPEPPGIGAMLVDGPGTLWETWWIDDDNVGVASLDHIGLAAPFAAWVWSHVAGLCSLTDGHARFLIAPRLLGPVNRVHATRETVRGRIELDWRLEGGELTLHLTVPVGAVAVVDVPAAGLAVDGVPAADHAHACPTDAGVELPTGRYVVHARGVARSAVRGAIGLGPDVPVAGAQELSLVVPQGADACSVSVDDGWEAELTERGVRVAPPPAAAVDDTAELVLRTTGRPDARRTVRIGHSGRWLSDGVIDSRWTPAPGSQLRVIDGAWVCTPVFHGPIPGPIVEVDGGEFAPEETHWLRLPLDDEPADLGDARVAHADVDLCFPVLPGHRLRPVLRLTSADGETIEGRLRPMPVCWNRVSVDVTRWPGRSAVAEVAIGLRWHDLPDSARGFYVPAPSGRSRLPFRVGGVGWTSAPRTW